MSVKRPGQLRALKIVLNKERAKFRQALSI